MRCATIGCRNAATHKLVYSFQESRGTKETDLVCESCGAGYVRRPTLHASLTVLHPTNEDRFNPADL